MKKTAYLPDGGFNLIGSPVAERNFLSFCCCCCCCLTKGGGDRDLKKERIVLCEENLLTQKNFQQTTA